MSLSQPIVLQERLEAIERDLANRQEPYETAARGWFKHKREREKTRAKEFLKAQGSVAERNSVADEETATMGMVEEADYEAQKSVFRVLETRASILQSLLRTARETA